MDHKKKKNHRFVKFFYVFWCVCKLSYRGHLFLIVDCSVKPLVFTGYTHCQKNEHLHSAELWMKFSSSMEEIKNESNELESLNNVK